MGILQEGIISDGLFMSYFSYVIDFLLSFFTTRIYCAKICFSFAFSKCLFNFFAFNFCFIVLFRFLEQIRPIMVSPVKPSNARH